MDRATLLAKFAEKFPGIQEAAQPVRDYPTFRLAAAADLVPAARWLKEELGFDYLDMVTATDWLGPVDLRGYVREANPHVIAKELGAPGGDPAPAKKNEGVGYRDAIELLYCFSNFREKAKVFLKLDVPRSPASAPSLFPVFHSADWQEREAFDLLGVAFDGHPNLAKILTPDFIAGNPLRKDYVHQKDRYDS
ncbi:MAG: hypothetical protein A2X36_15285 [Elusimicrobia bacterium GWA2_69_24]|nr:MAG: hypothetical protein A2X36_15285 [Elusimicrobia bacterium GWA2_69_24]HBL16821.1 hypothetical protein [Elusimicrobiota bacterium]